MINNIVVDDESLSPSGIAAWAENFIEEHDLHRLEIINLPNLRNADPDTLKELLSRLGAKLAFVETLMGSVDSEKVLYEEAADLAMDGYMAWVQINVENKKRVAKDSIRSNAYLKDDVISVYKNKAIRLKVLQIRLEHIRNALQAAYNAVSRVVGLVTGEMERLRS